ncbi:MAG: histone deacetylase family protein [Thermoplasmatota archaeon]
MEVIFHPKYLEHKQNGNHPESPHRLKAILNRLEKEKLQNNIVIPEKAEVFQLNKVHTEKYIEMIKNGRERYLDGGDTYLRNETYNIALLSAGGAIKSLELAKEGRKNMALLRPPGHHSGGDYGGGFCYFNNIGIAAKVSGYDRVAILDIDGHHGNGTSDIFYRDNSVLYVSLHNQGIYPGTGAPYAVGEGKGIGTNVNIPLKTGAGDSTLNFAWKELISPVLYQYEPEIILVSIGTDGHYKDWMTGLSYSSQSFVEMSKKFIKSSDDLCDGRISFMLEGGYHLESLSEIIAAIVALGEDNIVDLNYTEVFDKEEKGKKEVLETKKALRHYWTF